MTHLFADWERIAQKLGAARRRLFLIAKTPESARVPARTRQSLGKLAGQPNNAVGIISGRALRDAKKMIGLKGLIYSGNHGLEIEAPGYKFVHSIAANQPPRSFVRILRLLRTLAHGVRGLRIENKRLTVAIHYRGVSESQMHRVLSLERKIRYLAKRNHLSIQNGKKVLEIRPNVSWDKGTAVSFIRRRIKPDPIVFFAGDDATDEAVFRRMGKKDIGVHIGSAKSNARYYLSQKDVGRLLNQLERN